MDHEKLHGGAYGRAADGDLQVPPREPHTALLAASCQESEERSPERGGGGGGGGSWHELTDRGEGEEEDRKSVV